MIRIMMKKRALGFSQHEIAKVLKITQSAVKYHLTLLKKRAEKEGDDIVFTDFFNLVVLSPSEVKFTYGLDTAANRYTLHGADIRTEEKK